MKQGLARVLTIVVVAGSFVVFSAFMDNDRVDRSGLKQLKNSNSITVQPGAPGFKVNRTKTVVSKDLLGPVMAPHKGGLIRGIMLGMSMQSVKSLESSTLLQEQDLKLVYRISSQGDDISVQITYDFNYDKELTLVTVDFFAERTEDAALVKQAYEAYFSNMFGPYQLDTSGYMNWRAQSPQPYSVFLKEVSIPGDAGITLQFVGL